MLFSHISEYLFLDYAQCLFIHDCQILLQAFEPQESLVIILEMTTRLSEIACQPARPFDNKGRGSTVSTLELVASGESRRRPSNKALYMINARQGISRLYWFSGVETHHVPASEYNTGFMYHRFAAFSR